MLKVDTNVALDFNDVLIIPQPTKISSRKQVNLVVEKETLHSKQILKGIPIISANMSAISSMRMVKTLAELGLFGALHKHYSVDDYIHFMKNENDDILSKTFFTFGLNDEKLKELFDRNYGYGTPIPSLINLDVANGYMESFVEYVSKVREFFPKSVIMAGNVVTTEGAQNLLNAGADIIKLGIGPGASCQTRLVAGVGLPQLSTILETAEFIDELGGLSCSDGGLINPGDFSKAFVAGADFVMAGSIFSGHDECDLPIIEKDGDKFMEYYGMSSEHAMNKHNGGMANYRSSEGKLVYVKYKGKVENTVNHILGGLRSTGSYINSSELKDFPLYGKFVRVHTTHNKIYGE